MQCVQSNAAVPAVRHAPHAAAAAAARPGQRRRPGGSAQPAQPLRRENVPARRSVVSAVPDDRRSFGSNGSSSSEPAADAPSTRQRRGSSGGGGGEAPPPPPPATLKQEAVASNREVSDKLIEVFLNKQPAEWRKLIAYSKQWPMLAKGVLDRIEQRAVEEEEQELQLALRRLGRRLATVNEELSLYQQLIDKFRAAPSRDWEGMVTINRNSLGTEFFKYLDLRIKAAHDSEKDQEALVVLGAQVAALVEAYDRVVEDEQSMDAAAENFSSLLQVESLEEADRKIDEMAATGKLDPALLLMMAKAYAGSKETDITREEVKDIMAHLYFKAKEGFAQQAPKEVRILKYLLTVESEQDRAGLLAQAFEPGALLEAGDKDYLCTTPPDLLNTVDNVLALYDGSRSQGTMAGDAAALMNPEVIERLRELQKQIRRQYM